jgi:hypothetical protein
MYEDFQVRWTAQTTATPEVVWDTITRRANAWLWEIEYEPRVGGAERGLTAGGTVTAWDAPHRFQTRLEQPDGHRNEITYDLARAGASGTRISYAHRTNVPADELETQRDACERHTDLYRHTLLAAAEQFAGRPAAYASVDTDAARADVLAALGLPARPAVGDRAAGGGVVDYATDPFVGVRRPDGLLRVYDRTRWGWGIAVAFHGFTGADAARAALSLVPTTTKVA